MRPALTVIVPVFNEAATVDRLLGRVVDAPYPDKQVIVVDDGSRDGTAEILAGWRDRPGFVVLQHDKNRGKGAAVRTGLVHALGDVTLVQDADLEYDPEDYPLVVEPILRGRARVVFGSRYMEEGKRGGRPRWTIHRWGVVLFNLVVWLLYGRCLSDEATCFKVAPTSLWRALDLEAERFELCPEMTAKICRLGLPILEVPIHYQPRTAKQGKKVSWRDAWPTVWTLVKWRFRRMRRGSRKHEMGKHESAWAGGATCKATP